jgi:hypothetical protein
MKSRRPSWLVLARADTLHLLYRCPVTGVNVQGMTTGDETDVGPQDRLEVVQCPACGGVHLVDSANAPKPPPETE